MSRLFYHSNLAHKFDCELLKIICECSRVILDIRGFLISGKFQNGTEVLLKSRCFLASMGNCWSICVRSKKEARGTNGIYSTKRLARAQVRTIAIEWITTISCLRRKLCEDLSAYVFIPQGATLSLQADHSVVSSRSRSSWPTSSLSFFSGLKSVGGWPSTSIYDGRQPFLPKRYKSLAIRQTPSRFRLPWSVPLQSIENLAFWTPGIHDISWA